MKKDEDPRELSRRRDLWLVPHGQKLCMRLILGEYDDAAHKHVPASQAGFTYRRGAPEQMLMLKLHKEETMSLQVPCLRGYIDMGIFFMSCVREC